jgi:phosphonate transport system permease protein
MSRAAAWRAPSPWPLAWLGPAVWGGLLAFLAWNAWNLEVDTARILRGLGRAGTVFARAIPPDFSRWPLLAEGIVESVQMATLSTALGVVLGIPVAAMAARNVAPRPVYAIGRAIIALGRTFHELIVAINSLGFFSKLLAEQIEQIDRGQVEAIRAAGAGRGAELVFGVLPQVLPRVIGLTVYQWDVHLRQSAIIGIVGAGGIGTTLYNSFSRYDYDFTLAILIVIVAIVGVGEWASARARRRIQ